MKQQIRFGLYGCNMYRMRDLVPASIKAVNAAITPKIGYQGLNMVTVSNPPGGMSVVASVTLPASRTAIFASPQYLCPEQFVRVGLLPGQSEAWTRSYEFHCENPHL